jgi:hypothetical protein
MATSSVARSSEAVRADDYEHRSTVYLLLASIAANLEWRFIPVTCKTGRRPILRVERQQRNTVARSSEAVRADDYEHRSTVYLLLASIAANLEWRFIPVTCKRVADPFYGWRNSSVTP